MKNEHVKPILVYITQRFRLTFASSPSQFRHSHLRFTCDRGEAPSGHWTAQVIHRSEQLWITNEKINEKIIKLHSNCQHLTENSPNLLQAHPQNPRLRSSKSEINGKRK